MHVLRYCLPVWLPACLSACLPERNFPSSLPVLPAPHLQAPQHAAPSGGWEGHSVLGRLRTSEASDDASQERRPEKKWPHDGHDGCPVGAAGSLHSLAGNGFHPLNRGQCAECNSPGDCCSGVSGSTCS